MIRPVKRRRSSHEETTGNPAGNDPACDGRARSCGGQHDGLPAILALIPLKACNQSLPTRARRKEGRFNAGIHRLDCGGVPWRFSAFALSLATKAPHSLRDNFARVEFFKGRSYREILAIAGTKPDSIIQQTDGRIIKMWKEAGYSIALEFDAQDVCLGVMDEQY